MLNASADFVYQSCSELEKRLSAQVTLWKPESVSLRFYWSLAMLPGRTATSEVYLQQVKEVLGQLLNCIDRSCLSVAFRLEMAGVSACS